MKKLWLGGGLLSAAACALALGYNRAWAQDGPPAPTGSADVAESNSYGAGGTGPATTGTISVTAPAAAYGGDAAPATISLTGPGGAGAATIAAEGGSGQVVIGSSDAVHTVTIGPPVMTGGGDRAGYVSRYNTTSDSAADQSLRAEDAALEQQVQMAVGKYADPSQDDSARSTLRQELTQLLDKQFAIRQKQREQEIEQIEMRVKALRAALDKRANAKDKIIERRLGELLSDADGLGWGEPGGGFRYGFGFGGRGMGRSEGGSAGSYPSGGGYGAGFTPDGRTIVPDYPGGSTDGAPGSAAPASELNVR